MHEKILIFLTFVLVTSGCYFDARTSCLEHYCNEDEVCIENAPYEEPTCLPCQSICPEGTHCEVTDSVQRCIENLSCEELDCPPDMHCVRYPDWDHYFCDPLTCEDVNCITPKICVFDEHNVPSCVCPDDYLSIERACYSSEWICEQEDIETPSFRLTSMYILEPRLNKFSSPLNRTHQLLLNTTSTQLLLEIDREDETMSIRYGPPMIEQAAMAFEEFCMTEIEEDFPSVENIPINIEGTSISMVEPIESFDLIFTRGPGEVFSLFPVKNLELIDLEFDPFFSVSGVPPWQYTDFAEIGEVTFDDISRWYSDHGDFWIRPGILRGWITLYDVLRPETETEESLCDVYCSPAWCDVALSYPSYDCSEGRAQEIPELGGELGWPFVAHVAFGAVTIVE